MSQVSREVHHTNETSLALYDEACQSASKRILAKYSSSFGLGARLLSPAMRSHISSIYAMVRIADEVVDTYQGDDAAEVLADFEATVSRAMEGTFCTDVVAHAFGVTARAVGIGHDLVDPFFASMRMDLTDSTHTQESFEQYIYGSAEVIGEMCLAVFMATEHGPGAPSAEMRAGARALGSAYQKINFLRDVGADLEARGRIYFPGLTMETFTDAAVARIAEDCRADLNRARTTLPGLPSRARGSVSATLAIYENLLERIEATPAQDRPHTRVSVPRRTKVVLASRAMASARKGNA